MSITRVHPDGLNPAPEPDDVVRSIVYVAITEHADLEAVWDRLVVSALGEAFTTASTLP